MSIYPLADQLWSPSWLCWTEHHRMLALAHGQAAVALSFVLLSSIFFWEEKT
jgi:hypothetical protein